MNTKPLLITNNDKAHQYCKDKMKSQFLKEGTYLDVLYAARDYIHQGHRLLSHPMAGSLKPNQTPYRSIILETVKSSKDETLESILLIENSIETARKFLKGKSLPHWPANIKDDFKTVDASFICGFVDKLSINH